MRNAGDNPLEIGERVFDLRAIAGDHKFSDALVVPGATHLEHIQSTRHLTADLHVLKQQDGVRDRGDVGIGDRVAARTPRRCS